MAKKAAKRAKRDSQGRFVPGTPNISGGRPKVGDTRLDKLLQAVARVESKKNKCLLDHFVERAFESDRVLISVVKKMIPDLKAIEVAEFEVMPEDLARDIQRKLRVRFGKAS